MGGSSETIPVDPRTGHVFDLRRIGRIVTFEVMEDELNRLETLVSQENSALGFMCATGGALVSTLVSWVTSAGNHLAFGLFSVVLGLLTAWYGNQYRLAKIERPRLVDLIRRRGATIEVSPAA